MEYWGKYGLGHQGLYQLGDRYRIRVRYIRGINSMGWIFGWVVIRVFKAADNLRGVGKYFL